MDQPLLSKKHERRRQLFGTVFFILAGILINGAGARIALYFHWPLFLDSAGTIAVSALVGYFPGIVVGFLTNLLNGLADYTTIYYCSINVLLALGSSFLARKGCFSRVLKLPLSIGLLSFIGGGLGSVLTWYLYGGGIGGGVSAPLARAIYGSGHVSLFFSQFLADLAIDVLDKTVVVCLLFLLLCLLPDKVKKRLEAHRAVEKELPFGKKISGLSLRAKILLIISACAIVITAVTTGICLAMYHDSVVAEESKMAIGIANTAASCFDADRVEEYLALGEKAPGYGEAEARLESIAASAHDISYVYVYQIREDGCHVVFDADTAELAGAEPGTIIEFDQAFMPYIPALLAGEEIDPIISDETYGWLLTVYLPVYNSEGRCACYVGVDIAMSVLTANESIFLARVLSLFLGFFIVILGAGIYAADHSLVGPINAMADVTTAFARDIDDEKLRQGSLEAIKRLEVDTGDEIENLYGAIRTMGTEVLHYVEAMRQKNEQILRLQNGLVLVLADMVESRDQCTGFHVQNTAAYVRILMDTMRAKGIYADVLTDEYVYDVGSSAPLHDVGKIQIPDALLNKPGKLTDEEFKEMKCHTVRGAEIIDRAMGMLDGESAIYLTEARNLTLYHHERWDGRGYPEGLKGEEIPLSARIMAVADVFDALISRRSYKEGFPFEKAVAIIKEESGTHFDPQIVEAFLASLDKIREVSRRQ